MFLSFVWYSYLQIESCMIQYNFTYLFVWSWQAADSGRPDQMLLSQPAVLKGSRASSHGTTRSTLFFVIYCRRVGAWPNATEVLHQNVLGILLFLSLHDKANRHLICIFNFQKNKIYIFRLHLWLSWDARARA
jgi:hypothetical protein